MKHIKTHPIKKSENKFLMKIDEKGYVLLSEYTGANNKVKLRCSHDGNEWEVRPSSITRYNVGCPVCYINKTKNKFPAKLDEKGYELLSEYNKKQWMP